MPVLSKARLFPEDEKAQLVHLSRHFFERFFDIEIISDEAEAHLDVVQILALLAVPGMFFAMFRYLTYNIVFWHYSPATYASLTLTDQSMYVFFSMIVIGIVAVLEWERIFPDARDYANLAALPIRNRTIFCAKVSALARFTGLFILAVAGPPVVMYPLVSSQGLMPPPGFGHVVWMMVAHAIAVFSGCLFVFLFFVAVQGILINLLSYRHFRRVSLYVQGLATLLLVFQLFLMPVIPGLLPVWEEAHSWVLYALPPVWYLAIYRTLLGAHGAVFVSMARLSIIALAVAVAVAAVTYLVSYKRFSRKTFEIADECVPSRFGTSALLTRLLDRLWVKEGPERGTFYFVLKTLARSAKHRLCFTAYVAVGLAIVTTGLVGLAFHTARGDLWAAATRPSQALISIPTVIAFFALVGMRAAFGVPAELPANWIFKMTEENCGNSCLAGARKAMIALAMVPLFAVSFAVYTGLWGSLPAAMVVLTGILLSLILVEPLMYSQRKIPFTCAHQPGKFNIPLTGMDSWLVFALYVYSMALLETWIPHEHIMWAVVFVAEMVALKRIITRRNRSFNIGLGIEYEARPAPVVQTLDLSA